jgi:hypothetical protein
LFKKDMAMMRITLLVLAALCCWWVVCLLTAVLQLPVVAGACACSGQSTVVCCTALLASFMQRLPSALCSNMSWIQHATNKNCVPSQCAERQLHLQELLLA